MIQFAHTNLITDDWRRLADFYTHVFNCYPLPPERDLRGDWLDRATGIDRAHLRGMHLVLPGYEGNAPTLEIFQYEENLDHPGIAPNRKGFGHIAFRVDEVDIVLARLLQYGGSVLGEVVQTNIPGAGHLTFVYAKDPDGNIIELQNWSKG